MAIEPISAGPPATGTPGVGPGNPPGGSAGSSGSGNPFDAIGSAVSDFTTKFEALLQVGLGALIIGVGLYVLFTNTSTGATVKRAVASTAKTAAVLIPK